MAETKMRKGTKEMKASRAEIRKLLAKHTRDIKGKKQLVYKDNGGNEHYECVGAYSTYVTRSVVKGLMSAAVFFPELRSVCLGITSDMKAVDDNLCRMIDDRKGCRELIAFDYDSVTRLFAKIKEAEELASKEAGSQADKVMEQLLFCAVRLMYILKWSVWLTVNEEIDEYELEATTQMFDFEEKEQLAGPSDEDAEAIRFIFDAERKFLHLYLTAEIESEEEEKSLDMAERMDLAARLIAEGKMEEFLKKVNDIRADGRYPE